MYMQVASMSTARGSHLCEVVNNQIYVMGGIGNPVDDASAYLSTTEVYEPRANAWREGPDMGLPRANGNSGVLDGTLYVMCGTTEVRLALHFHVVHILWLT
jgi:hypothetical protein